MKFTIVFILLFFLSSNTNAQDNNFTEKEKDDIEKVLGPRLFKRPPYIDVQKIPLRQQLERALRNQPGHPARFLPIRTIRPVGYRPVIVWLPTGTSMRTSALVSADRRYVRIGVSPMFSGVTSVYSFSYRR